MNIEAKFTKLSEHFKTDKPDTVKRINFCAENLEIQLYVFD